jgi:hypothetical protein
MESRLKAADERCRSGDIGHSCGRPNLTGGVFQASGRFNRTELGDQGGRKLTRKSLNL